MGLFSGILVNATEDKGFELSMEDVRIQFNEAFEVLNAEAANFESFCSAVEKLEMLHDSIQAHDGKADKGVIAFLNQNNSLADALGISLSMEEFNDIVVGSETCAAIEGALANVWEAIKNFFKNIYDGIKNFFKNFFNMFRSAEKKAAAAAANAAKIAENIAAGNGSASSRFKIVGNGSPTGCSCVKIEAFNNKIGAIVELGNMFGKLQNVETAIVEMLTANGSALIKAFQACGVSFKNGEPANGSIWQPNDVITGQKTVGAAFKAAGWTQDSITAMSDAAKKLTAAGASIEKGSAVLDQFNKMNDEQITAILKSKSSNGGAISKEGEAGADLKSLKKIGKVVIHGSKVIGSFTKDFIALLDDINALSAAQKAEENAQAAAAEAKQKQAEADAQKPAQLG